MIRIATVGTGSIVTGVCDAVARTEGIEVSLVYSRTLERARAFAAEVGAPGAVGSWEELLASDVDAVYVASPNSLHVAQTRDLLMAGKHVLLEKPVTPTLAELDELIALADERGLVLMEAMRSTDDPGTLAVADLLPRLGILRHASLRYVQRSSRYDRVLAGDVPNAFDPAMGGGALNDLGCYALHQLLAWFGEPADIVGRGATIPTGVDGAAAMMATYDGFVAQLLVSKVAGSPVLSDICGEDATLVIDAVAEPRHLELRLVDGTVETIDVDADPHVLQPEVRRFRDLVNGADGIDELHARSRAVMRLLESSRG